MNDDLPQGADRGASRPHIDYPCEWPYTVIAHDAVALEGALTQELSAERAAWRRNRSSSGGRYTSFHVAVEVRDESHRNDVFVRLQALVGVRVVL